MAGEASDPGQRCAGRVDARRRPRQALTELRFRYSGDRAPMADNGQQHFAERMFPEPVDPGIARPDRAASSVEHGTDTGPKGEWRNEVWYQGGGAIGEKAVERIQIYPPTHGQQTQGDPLEPVQIGILVDMELGQLLADWIDPTILAIEDAMNEGVYQRGPVELLTVDARGLPRENYLKASPGLPQARGRGLRRRARADDLGQLREHPRPGERDRGRVHRLDRRAPGSTASTASPSPTATSPPSPSCARSGASRTATRRSASSGSSARRAPTTATGS